MTAATSKDKSAGKESSLRTSYTYIPPGLLKTRVSTGKPSPAVTRSMIR